MARRLVTIGVYGFSADAFFAALARADVDLVCDVRARRGVRGAEYAFANARRLVARLGELGIAYAPHPELGPSRELRERQYAEDERAGVGQRTRVELSPAFVHGYEREVLSSFSPEAFVASTEPARSPALLCVEREPAACHRSLLADRIARATGLPVEHLVSQVT